MKSWIILFVSAFLVSCAASWYVNKDELIGQPKTLVYAKYGQPVYVEQSKETFRFQIKPFPSRPSDYRSFTAIYDGEKVKDIIFND